MKAPTQQQLNDPAWWDRHAPDHAEVVWLIWDDTPVSRMLTRIVWANRDEGVISNQSQSVENYFRPTKPEPQAWDGEGDIPPLGQPCEVSTNGLENWTECRVKYASSIGVVVELLERPGLEAWMKYGDHTKIDFRPIRTQAERERDELLEILSGRNWNGATNGQVADAIIAAGWRKGE